MTSSHNLQSNVIDAATSGGLVAKAVVAAVDVLVCCSRVGDCSGLKRIDEIGRLSLSGW